MKDCITAEEFLKVLKPVSRNPSAFEFDVDVAASLIGRKIVKIIGDMVFSVGLIYGVDLSYKESTFEKGYWTVSVMLATSVGKYGIDCIWSVDTSTSSDREITVIDTKPTDHALHAKERSGTHVLLKISVA